MNMMKRTAALVLALVMLFAAALGESWHISRKNVPQFQSLFNRLKIMCEEPRPSDRKAADAKVEAIRKSNADEGDVAEAIVTHWFANVLDEEYRMYIHRGEERTSELAESGLAFGKKHAFVVLGFRLENGEMAEELAGRCEAAAAAARAFPDAILVCTGGVTGTGNPEGHSEAGEMKKYLSGTCGIDPDRIFTEEESLTTAENAVNTVRILQEQEADTFTIVTSDYHQRWGQILFNAVAAMSEKETGHALRLIGNYNYPAQPEAKRTANCALAMNQLRSLIREEAGIEP